MNTVTAKEAKQHFGETIEKAHREPVIVTKHGRPSVVIVDNEEFETLQQIKYDHFKSEVLKGFNEIKNGEISDSSIDEIFDKFLEKKRKEKAVNE